MNQLPIETKDKKKKREDNRFTHCFAEWSLTLVAEMLINLIWQILLFIPRVLIRALSNLF